MIIIQCRLVKTFLLIFRFDKFLKVVKSTSIIILRLDIDSLTKRHWIIINLFKIIAFYFLIKKQVLFFLSTH
jgi:hypothetical protein